MMHSRCFRRRRLTAKTFNETRCATTQPTWLVRILPYLEEPVQAARWNLYGRFEDHAEDIRSFVPSVYVCPTRRTVQEAIIPSETIVKPIVYPCGCGGGEVIQLTSGGVGDYAGNHGDYTGGSFGEETDYWRAGNGTGVIISSQPICREGVRPGWIGKIRQKDLIDGASKTFLAGEMHIPDGRLAKVPENGPIYDGADLPAFGRIGGPGIPLASGPADTTVPIIGFGSWHPGVCPFVLADGSVQIVENLIDTEVLRSYCRRADDAADPAAVDPPQDVM